MTAEELSAKQLEKNRQLKDIRYVLLLLIR